MRRFFHSSPVNADGTLELGGPEARHASRVIRLQPGDRAVLLDGQGHSVTGKVVEVGRDRVAFEVLDTRTQPRPGFRLKLYQALIKGKAFDQIIQKSVELGVNEIVPVVTDRCVVSIGRDDEQHKVERWRQTAIEALKQCGGAWLPRILEPTPLADLIARRGCDALWLVASLQTDARDLRSVVDAYRGENGFAPDLVGLWIGPEGDFTDNEYRQLVEIRAEPIRLGENILRSETAAICGVSIVQYELSRSGARSLTEPTP